MKPTFKNALPCAVFGHNYVIIGPKDNRPSTLACKHCGQLLETNHHGDFEEDSITNRDVKNTLRQLFHLKLKVAKLSIKP